MNMQANIIANYIENTWQYYPKWLKRLLYFLAKVLNKWDNIEWLYDIVEEIYWQVEYESPWFQGMIQESLQDINEFIEGGCVDTDKVKSIPSGMSVSEWLDSICEEEHE